MAGHLFVWLFTEAYKVFTMQVKKILYSNSPRTDLFPQPHPVSLDSRPAWFVFGEFKRVGKLRLLEAKVGHCSPHVLSVRRDHLPDVVEVEDLSHLSHLSQWMPWVQPMLYHKHTSPLSGFDDNQRNQAPDRPLS